MVVRNIIGMMTIEPRPTRTLTLVIQESDWHALRAAEPDAIGWLHSVIRERLASTTSGALAASRYSPPSAATADSWWGNDDEY
jgi:hypothetical protein